MDDYLSKPLSAAELVRVCRRFIDTPAAERAEPESGCEVADGPAEAFRVDGPLGDISPAEQREILVIFVDQLATALPQLARAVAGDDRDTVDRIAHRLAGSAASLGMTELATAMRELSAQARGGGPLQALQVRVAGAATASLTQVSAFLDGDAAAA
jgi:HPt (histidine-containing phosphotransfer) domain-containing protein